MPTPTFQRLDLSQFEALLNKFPFTRKVNAVHMHHTWKPRRMDFRGHDTIVGMWRHHTQVNGWSDIAQHITIDPEGVIWLGRNWNVPPASASGYNGNSVAGPFMFEMVGDFDVGRESFDGVQKDTALRVVALVQRRFGLRAATLYFHSTMSGKTCPGSGISYDQTLAEVEELHAELQAAVDSGGARSTGVLQAFSEDQDEAIRQAIQSLTRLASPTGETGDAEDNHDGDGCEHCDESHEQTAAVRSRSGFDSATLAAMRPHLVNLRSGIFSDDGELTSSEEDVDAIFEEHLLKAVDALPTGTKLNLLFYAHGGLVSEASALQGAYRHIGWWKRNDVYPLYFIWETGLFETIGQLLGRTRARSRDLADYTTDPLIEAAARALQGPRIWGGMKWAAERASQPGGAAHYVAKKLSHFLATRGDRVALHAIGHSAGSIFHAHFLPACRAQGVPAFKTLQLLAPAIRVDTFKQLLLPGLHSGTLAESTSLFTMSRDFERDDDCAKVYRKSLLYLIYYALEDARRTPILGLEESLRGDSDLKAFLGLGGNTGPASVVWSTTESDTGRSASRSTTHGGFDDDAPTMNSVLRRLLNRADADSVQPFPIVRSLQRAWIEEVDWPADWPAGPPVPVAQTTPNASTPWVNQPPSIPLKSALTATPGAGGRRIALCMGVDAYPDPQHRLAGCTNDARAWTAALQAQGFDVHLLLDAQVTREAMKRELIQLMKQSRSGDVIVVQFSGHGTYIPDSDGDERTKNDQAFCPVDFASGALLLDDDVRQLIDQWLPAGVNLTFFPDCCHSQSNTRVALAGAKARLVRPTLELIRAHERFRGGKGRGRSKDKPLMRHVSFAACKDEELALELDGNGEFTRRALRVLRLQGLTNDDFLQAVRADFGPSPRQNPQLDCAEPMRGRAFLQPIVDAAVSTPPARSSEVEDSSLVPVLRAMAEALQLLSHKL